MSHNTEMVNLMIRFGISSTFDYTLRTGKSLNSNYSVKMTSVTLRLPHIVRTYIYDGLYMMQQQIGGVIN